MKISAQLVDTVVLQEIGDRLARLRLERNLKQADLAVEAGVSKRTVERMEAGGPTQLVNLVRVCRALGLLERLEMLVPEATVSPVAQLIQQGKKRKRATAVKVPKRASKWQWNDKP
jgi:transcriptional regulator with XRE-family HTH domain